MIGEDLQLKQTLTCKVGQTMRIWFRVLKKISIMMLVSFMILGCGFLGCSQIEGPVTPTPPISIPTPATDTPIVTRSPDVIQSPRANACPEGMVPFPVESFCLDINEVTNGQYQVCVAVETCTEPHNNDEYYQKATKHPVINVTWEQAEQYCNFVGKRLPTAAEWDRAANYAWPSDDEITKYEDTQEVGTIRDVSNEKVNDLAGNAREWVTNDHDLTDHKLVKGYDFLSTNNKTKNYHKTDYYDSYLGFRCAANSK